MIKDQVKVTGNVTILKYDLDGSLVESREITNLVVAIGKTHIASRLSGAPAAAMTHMAIGAPSSIIVPISTDTTLKTEIARVALGTVGGVASGNTVQYTATFGAGVGTNTSITEAGIFSASTAGTMLARTTFSSFSKSAVQSIVVVWVITIS